MIVTRERERERERGVGEGERKREERRTSLAGGVNNSQLDYPKPYLGICEQIQVETCDGSLSLSLSLSLSVSSKSGTLERPHASASRDYADGGK